MNSNKRRLGSTGMGVIGGIIGTLLTLALVFGVMMLVIGHCPMCGSVTN